MTTAEVDRNIIGPGVRGSVFIDADPSLPGQGSRHERRATAAEEKRAKRLGGGT